METLIVEFLRAKDGKLPGYHGARSIDKMTDQVLLSSTSAATGDLESRRARGEGGPRRRRVKKAVNKPNQAEPDFGLPPVRNNVPTNLSSALDDSKVSSDSVVYSKEEVCVCPLISQSIVLSVSCSA